MWRGSLKGWVECLVGALLFLSAVQERLDVGRGGEAHMVTGHIRSAKWSIDALQRWSVCIMALAFKLPTVSLASSEVQAPSILTPGWPPSLLPSSEPLVPRPHLIVNKSLTRISALALPTELSIRPSLPALPLLQKAVHASVVSPVDSAEPPLPVSMNSLVPAASSSLTMSPLNAMLAPTITSSSSTPQVSSPSQDSRRTDGSATTSEAPLTSPSSGCCAINMVPRPGLPSDSCICVYPLRLELLVDNVSTGFANWSSEFQQELASQLDVEVIQIQITSFEFHGPNLTLVIVIGPLTSDSFSAEQAETIKTDLDELKVHFNNSLFGAYTLLRFRYFVPPSPTPVQAPTAGLPPLPLLRVVPHDAGVGASRRHRLSIWSVLAMAAAAVILASVIFFGVWKSLQPCKAGENGYRYTLRASSNIDDRSEVTESIPRSVTTRFFTFDELKVATNNFEPESLLGEGGFGRVYKGVLKDGTAVAIKRLGGGSQGDREFLVEVEMLSRLHHRNLVKLIGYYTSRDSSQHLLCYELIPNGSLEAWLHGPPGANQPLDWDVRMKIALDAARGLAYLHEDSQPCVIHRDFKASNILIENNFHAKVADFGLAKQAPEGQTNYVATRVMGTFGYVAPEYAMTGHLLVKSDVYSYGVVLLELLTGRKPVDMSQPPGQENLVTWARPILRDGERLWELVDPRLLDKYPREDFAQVVAIAAACVAPEANQRPTMGEVVQSLKMVQRSSDYYTTSGERTTSMDITQPTKSSSSSVPHTQPTAAIFESDGSSSVFSSGPFSGHVHDQDMFSRTAVFSEDLHEGR